MAAGCDVNRRTTKTGETALHIAVKKKNSALVGKLLASGRVEYICNYAVSVNSALVGKLLASGRVEYICNYAVSVNSALVWKLLASGRVEYIHVCNYAVSAECVGRAFIAIHLECSTEISSSGIASCSEAIFQIMC